jgi:thiamine-phosphate pyrophosphorylase
VKSLWVTDRQAIGDEAFVRMLDRLSGAPGLSVEIREKEVPDRDVLDWARRARRALDPATPVSVNRRFDIARASGADGVHLPSDGLPGSRVRPLVPRGFRIGISTHDPREAAAALEDGFDVVVIGPIFPTPSKAGMGAPLGVAALSALPPVAGHSAEVFAIGGIDEGSIEALDDVRDRISGVAAIRMFQNAADPRAVVERIAAR